MSLVERFIDHAESFVGKWRIQDPETFVREVFCEVTVSPLEGLKAVGWAETRHVGDLAFRQGHAAVYVGRGRWVESGLRIHSIDSSTLQMKDATVSRPKVVLEVPHLEGDYFYWGLVFGTGQQINSLKAWCKSYGMPISTKMSSRKWEKFGHEAVTHLPE